MANKNLTGIVVDDDIVQKFENVKKHNSGVKCMCMKMHPIEGKKGKYDRVILDEAKDLMEDEGPDVPDFKDTKSRLAYETALFKNQVHKLAADPKQVVFFTWSFYFSTGDTTKTKPALVSWVADEGSVGEKMCGASAHAELLKKLQVPGFMMKDGSDMDYHEICSAVTQNMKN